MVEGTHFEMDQGSIWRRTGQKAGWPKSIIYPLFGAEGTENFEKWPTRWQNLAYFRHFQRNKKCFCQKCPKMPKQSLLDNSISDPHRFFGNRSVTKPPVTPCKSIPDTDRPQNDLQIPFLQVFHEIEIYGFNIRPISILGYVWKKFWYPFRIVPEY